MEIRTDIQDTGVAAAIARARDLGADLRQPLAAAGRALLTRVQLGFRRSQDPYGRPWKPVKRGGQPLVDRGRLRRSFGFQVERDGVVIGTYVRYAAVHQEGATITARNHPYLRFRVGGQWVRKRSVTIPARPMLPNPAEGLPPTWSGDVVRVFEDYLGGA